MAEHPNGTSYEPNLLDHAPPGAMCLGCRYDISGMDIRAKCPECGDRIAPLVNNICIERANPEFLRAIDEGTHRAWKAGLVALAGLALLCAGYTMSTKGLATNASLFGTLMGSSLLFVSIGLAIYACWHLGHARMPGEEPRIKTLRKAIPITAVIVAAVAVASACIMILIAMGLVEPDRRSLLSRFFILWIVYPFVPIYIMIFLQMLAGRSRVLNSHILPALIVAGFFALMLMPVTLSSSNSELFALFGIRVANPYPFRIVASVDPAYVWPAGLGTNIILALVAIAYFRKGMGFPATSADPPHEPPRL